MRKTKISLPHLKWNAWPPQEWKIVCFAHVSTSKRRGDPKARSLFFLTVIKEERKGQSRRSCQKWGFSLLPKGKKKKKVFPLTFPYPLNRKPSHKNPSSSFPSKPHSHLHVTFFFLHSPSFSAPLHHCRETPKHYCHKPPTTILQLLILPQTSSLGDANNVTTSTLKLNPNNNLQRHRKKTQQYPTRQPLCLPKNDPLSEKRKKITLALLSQGDHLLPHKTRRENP